MADLLEFENVEHPESSEFNDVDKTEPEASEPEQPPEVTSTTNTMDEPNNPESEQVSPQTEEESVPEESSKETTETEEKPSSSSEPSSTSRELTSFPARWMKEHSVDHRVINLIYWQDIKKTVVVFATLVVVLLSLHMYSLLSVITFFSMAILTVALLYRVGMTVMGAIQKSGTDNPFKNLLEKDIEISKEKAADFAECVAGHINCVTKDLRRLFLVEDIIDSIKFGVMLWVLSYVGSWFSMLTLLIVVVVFGFVLPKIYEDHQDKIDEHVKVVRNQVNAIVEQAKSKLPDKLKPKEKTT